jgi:RimJ/RimL family protein N-acetyltransferase
MARDEADLVADLQAVGGVGNTEAAMLVGDALVRGGGVVADQRRARVKGQRLQSAVEIAWRLTRLFWGGGYATEAARAALDYGFGKLGLAEIVAVTVPANARSRGVMERLGMIRQPADDFDHPNLPEGPLKRHVLYRLRHPSPAPKA